MCGMQSLNRRLTPLCPGYSYLIQMKHRPQNTLISICFQLSIILTSAIVSQASNKLDLSNWTNERTNQQTKNAECEGSTLLKPKPDIGYDAEPAVSTLHPHNRSPQYPCYLILGF
jgi:hypothetical protein